MKKTNKILALFVMFAMIITLIPVSLSANDAYTLTFSIKEGTTHTIEIDGGHLKIDGTYVDLRDENNTTIGTVAVSGTTATIFVNDGTSGSLNFNSNVFTLFANGNKYNYEQISTNTAFLIDDYSENSNPPAGSNKEGSKQATVRIKGGDGSYQREVYVEEENKTVNETVYYKDTYSNAGIAINDSDIMLAMPEDEIRDSENNLLYSELSYRYNPLEDSSKVRLTFSTLFLNAFEDNVKVNGTSYKVSDYINYSDRTDWLAHYDSQTVNFSIDVPKADDDIYNIEVNVGEADKNIYIGNFLWTSDENQEYAKDRNGNIIVENGEKIKNDVYFGHAVLRFVSATYKIGDTTTTVTANDIKDENGNYKRSGYIEFNVGPDRENPNFEGGSLVAPDGTMVTLQIIPEYGYQVKYLSSNGFALTAGDDISTFTFEVGKGNFHLGAEVVPVADEVITTSESVKTGNIEIDSNEISNGSVRLSVDDVKINDEKKLEFEKQAEGYTVSNYLNISLNQVLFKGTADDVWSNELEDLSKEALISLQLSEDIDPENTVIVHNIHDGKDYEVIKIEKYDSATKTITFKTKSFSNYAIATKTVEKEEYTVDYTDFEIVFTENADKKFTLLVKDVLNLTDEDLKEFEITKEEYQEAMETLNNALKDYKNVINTFVIEVYDEDGNQITDGPFTFKIKMTDEMKKYNSFKLVNVDENDFSIKDVVELKVEDDYLVGTLPHLSIYALTAEKVEKVNPNTSDNIYMYTSILVLAIAGLFTTIKFSFNK